MLQLQLQQQQNDPPTYEESKYLQQETEDDLPNYEELHHRDMNNEKTLKTIEAIFTMYFKCCRSKTFNFILLSIIVLPLLSVTLGINCAGKCSVRPFLPIWLFINGLFGCITIIWQFMLNMYLTKGRQSLPKSKLIYAFIFTKFIFDATFFGWLVGGSIDMLSFYNGYDERSHAADTCPITCLFASFWSMKSIFILLPLLFFFLIICVLFKIISND